MSVDWPPDLPDGEWSTVWSSGWVLVRGRLEPDGKVHGHAERRLADVMPYEVLADQPGRYWPPTES